MGTSRKVIFLIHQYLGFTVGIYFIVICATGAALILLENRIDPAASESVESVRQVP